MPRTLYVTDEYSISIESTSSKWHSRISGLHSGRQNNQHVGWCFPIKRRMRLQNKINRSRYRWQWMTDGIFRQILYERHKVQNCQLQDGIYKEADGTDKQAEPGTEKKKLLKSYFCNILLNESETQMLQKVKKYYLGSIDIWCCGGWRRSKGWAE